MEGHCTEMALGFNIKKLIAMRKNQSTPLSIGVILEEDKGEDEIDEDAVDDGITSVDSLSTTPTGVETPDVIDLRKAQHKKPEKQLYQCTGLDFDHSLRVGDALICLEETHSCAPLQAWLHQHCIQKAHQHYVNFEAISTATQAGTSLSRTPPSEKLPQRKYEGQSQPVSVLMV